MIDKTYSLESTDISEMCDDLISLIVKDSIMLGIYAFLLGVSCTLIVMWVIG